MKRLAFLTRTSSVTLALWTLLLCGCAGIGESLSLKKTVLVKVPIDTPITAGSSDGWKFLHVLEAPKDEERRGQWYVAWNDQKPIVTSRLGAYWRTIFSRAAEIAAATKGAFGRYPLLIEPNRSFSQVAAKQPPEPARGERVKSEFGEGVRLVIDKPTLKVWSDARKPDPRHPGKFIIDPMWHLDEDHSQLAKARERLGKAGEGIRIGHLDNGLDARHPASPMNLEGGRRLANAVGLLDFAQRQSRGENPPNPIPPELTGSSHGLGTAGILAGSWVAIDEKTVPGGRIKEYYGWLGGAPHATVVPVKVAPWVISLSTAELAYSIDYASRRRKCDIISMSHGGAPTQAWVDAVNAAYERGTAMFAAEGDFFSLICDPFAPHGIIVPASPVYPAAFRRVVGVTGVTADQRSYASNSLWRLLGDITGIAKWAARGSHGADGTSTVLLRPNRKPDPSQLKRLGQLRPHPIAAYAPNIPWISVRDVKGKRVADGVDLDGAGTSAATPQVAAAAALWLQKNRAELEAKGYWSNWRKAEAVYHALLKSASRGDKQKADKYLGAGLLRASSALDVTLDEIEGAKPPPRGLQTENPPDGSLYFGKAPNDYFDGARSVWSVFGLHTWRESEGKERATLRQKGATKDTPAEAMQRLYYNLLLLREWHGGDVPIKDERDRHGNITRPRHETMYWNRARKLAEKSLAR
ncbi:MAG: S8/S53 family peptidase [Chthoniobacteraceae bacterium]